MLGSYRALAAVPHVFPLMICGLAGSLFMPANSLVLSFLFADFTGSYARAGVLCAGITAGLMFGGPLRGWLLDRISPVKVIAGAAVLYSAGQVTMILLTRPGAVPRAAWLWLFPMALVTGLVSPPASQVTRATWPKLLSGQQRDTAYAAESTLAELLFVIAPMGAAFMVATWGSAVAAAVVAAAALVGPALFAWAVWRAGLAQPGSRSREQGALAAGPLVTCPGFLRLMIFGTVLVGGLMSMDLVLVAWSRSRETPALAGVLAAVWAIGSLVGGLIAGARNRPPRLWMRALLVAAGLLALVPLLPPVADPAYPFLVGSMLFVAGLPVAPTLAASNGKLAGIAPSHRRAEAFGWWVSATTGGAALLSPVTGALLDTSGPASAAALSGCLLLFGGLLVAHHSLRGSHESPVKAETVAT